MGQGRQVGEVQGECGIQVGSGVRGYPLSVLTTCQTPPSKVLEEGQGPEGSPWGRVAVTEGQQPPGAPLPWLGPGLPLFSGLWARRWLFSRPLGGR